MTYTVVSGVYCLHCIATGKKYIGASTNIRKRFWEHKSASKTSNLPLYEDVRKYGWDNIIIGIVEEESDIDKLNQKEDYYIDKYDAINNGYNSQRSKPVPNEEHRRKISESFKGRVLSQDTRKRMSDAKKGKTYSEETRRKLSELKRHTYMIHNRNTDTIIEATNLQEWCIDNGINYQTIIKTIRKGRYTKSGYKIISATKD